MSALRDLVGQELGPSAWIDVTQERIDAFASQGERATIEATVECEGFEKPVCVATLLVLTVP